MQHAELTASSSGLRDPDGIDTGAVEYEWLRCNPVGDACNTTVGTGRSYTVAEGDVGRRLRVRARYVDRAGNAETATSNAWPSAPIRPYPACAVSDLPSLQGIGRRAFWTATMTPAKSRGPLLYYGFNAGRADPYGSMSPARFSLGPYEYEVLWLYSGVDSSIPGKIEFRIKSTAAYPESARAIGYFEGRNIRLHVCDREFTAGTAFGGPSRSDADYFFVPGAHRTVRMSVPISGDASLSDLSLSEGVLSPEFSPSIASYTATTGGDVSRVTVTPVTNDPGARVEYLDGHGRALADADPSSPATFEADLAVGSNVIAVRVTASNGATTRLYTVTVTRGADGLALTRVRVSSTPARGDDTYGFGETVAFTAEFNGDATVTGAPRLAFSLGDEVRYADYTAGSGSSALVFTYTVTAVDTDDDGISWDANALALNGGAIRYATDAAVDAALAHRAQGALEDHKVDGTRITSAPSAPRSFVAWPGDQDVLLRWEAPAYSGWRPIARYQYRYSPGATVAPGAAWTDVPDGPDPDTDAGNETELTVGGLVEGDEYAFELRAINAVVDGENTSDAVMASATPDGCTRPVLGDRRRIWTGTVAVAEIRDADDDIVGYGFNAVTAHAGAGGSLDPAQLDIGVSEIGVRAAWVRTSVGLRFVLDAPLTEQQRGVLELHVCGTHTYDLDAREDDAHGVPGWPDSGIDWSTVSTRRLYLSLPANTPATGAPTIDGSASVGQFLTADTSAIADEDGLVNVSYRYQWVRVDPDGISGPVDIGGATSERYTPTEDDLGRKLEVRVSFVDDLGATESLTSAAYPALGTVGPDSCRTPDLDGRRRVWTGRVTVGQLSGSVFGFNRQDDYGAAVGALDNGEFQFGQDSYTVDAVLASDSTLRFSLDRRPSGFDIEALRLHVCHTSSHDFSDDRVEGSAATWYWTDVLDWSRLSVLTAYLSLPPNTPATGLPAISGPARAGATLQADIAAVEDADGLPDTFGYQWLRVDADGASGEEVIDGATSSTYAPVEADVGSRLRVRVSFVDRLGSKETLTSEAYPAPGVVAASGVTRVDMHSMPGLTSSDPNTADTYGSLETIEFAVHFNANVDVTGTPGFVFDLGDGQRTAALESGSGASTLVFAYTVTPGDADPDGISWDADAIVLDDATIIDTERALPAWLTHDARDALPGHKVDGSRSLYVPGRVRNLETTTRDSHVTLHWDPPQDRGGSPIIRYRYRYATGATVGSGVDWTDVPDGSDADSDAGNETSVLITGLSLDTQYAFQVSAVNSQGAGDPVTVTTTTDTCNTPNFGSREVRWRGRVAGGLRVVNRWEVGGYSTSLSVGSVSPSGFTIGASNYTVDAVVSLVLGRTHYSRFSSTSALESGHVSALRLHHCTTTLNLSAATYDATHHHYLWEGGFRFRRNNYTVYLTLPGNNAATGAPVISGTPRVGETLTAAPGNVADEDGLTGATYAYQWVRVGADGSSDPEDIEGAGSSTYTLTRADAGKRIKVRVSFTDDFSNEEARTSAAFPSSDTVVDPCPVPDLGSRRGIWSGTVTVGPTGDVSAHGFAVPGVGGLDSTGFDIGARTHTVDELLVGAGDGDLTFGLADAPLSETERAALRLHVCDAPFDFSAATVVDATHAYRWSAGLDWSGATTREVRLSLSANRAPAGKPAVSGVAVVGAELSAQTDGITDADGLTGVVYAYRWLRVDADGVSNEEEIDGETAAAYTPAEVDVGRKVKVRVRFTDELGGVETLTSDAYPAQETGIALGLVSVAAEHPTATPRLADPAFRVTMSAVPAQPVVVTLAVAQDDAYLDADTQTITIDANETTAVGTFPSTYAGTTSGALTVTVTAGAGYSPAAAPHDTATVQVVAAYPPLGVAWVAETLEVAEGESVEAQLRLRTAAEVPAPRQPFAISVTSADDTAVSADDYAPVSAEVLVGPGDWVADGGEFVALKPVTVEAVQDTDYERAERFRVAFAPIAGEVEYTRQCAEDHRDPDHDGRCNAFVTIEDDDTFAVTGIWPSSTPQRTSIGSAVPDTYEPGETIEITVAFNAPVTVTGMPTFAFDLGGETKRAGDVSGSGTNMLVFSYDVQVGDTDDDGISWDADPISLDGGAIRLATDDPDDIEDAPLAYQVQDPLASHKVNTPPLLISAIMEGDTITLLYSEALDADSAPEPGAYVVSVDGGAGGPPSSVGVAGSTVTLTVADVPEREATVTLTYTVPASSPVRDRAGGEAAGFGDHPLQRILLRLMGSAADNEGRVEVFHAGAWGTVCDDYWTKVEADVACRIAGYSEGSVDDAGRFLGAYFGEGSGPIWLDNLQCRGDETSLFDCPRADSRAGAPAVGEHNCRHSEDVGVRCLVAEETAPPRVTGVTLNARPGDAWNAGETVEVTLAWSEAVVVETPAGGEPPKVWIGFSDEAHPHDSGVVRHAEYASGSETKLTVFRYTLQSGYGPSDLTGGSGDAWRPGLAPDYESVQVYRDSLRLRDGAIRSATSAVAAVLGHKGHPEAQPHLEAPQVAAEPTVSGPGPDGAWTPGETVEVGLAFDRQVLVTTTGGTPSVEIGFLAGQKRRAFYTFGSRTHELIFAYTLTEEDGTQNAILVTRDSLTLGGGLIRGWPDLAPAALGHESAAKQAGPARVVAPAEPTGSFSGVPDEHDGRSAFTLGFTMSEAPKAPFSHETVRDHLFEVTGARLQRAKRAEPDQDRAWNLTFFPGGTGAVTVRMRETRSCDASPRVCTEDGRPLTGEVSVTIPGPAQLSVADAEAQEGAGAVLDFVVTLSRARTGATTVDYATADDTATADEDYEARSGTLTFDAGVTERTISVAVRDDAHDEGVETLTLTLTNPAPAAYVRLGDAVATGRISNHDHMPRAWMVRFGRTVAEQVLDAVQSRMRAARAPGAEVSLAGQRIGFGPVLGDDADAGDREAEAEREARRLADRLSGGTSGSRSPESWPPESWPGAGGAGPRTVTGRELLLGSAFTLTAAPEAGGAMSLWGRSAVSRFEGREGDLTLDGEVVSGFLGWDWSLGPEPAASTVGLVVGHSRGEGGYRAGSVDGMVRSTLTGAYPWGRHAFSERLSVWGTAGIGEGSLTLMPEEGRALRTDLGLVMGAVGFRAVAVETASGGGPELAVTGDAMGVRTTTARARGLAESEADVTRLRLGVERSWAVGFAGGAALTPSVALGVRHDGGDAETGFGADIGGGVGWTDRRRGVTAELRGRGLLSHEASGLRERGVSGALSWEPASGGRGPRLRVAQTMGGASSGGPAALLGRGTLAGLGAGEDDLDSRRLEAEFGYGFAAFGGRFTWTPEARLGLSDAGRDYALGWRLARVGAGGAGGGLELAFEATRREGAGGAPEHAAELRLTVRF